MLTIFRTLLGGRSGLPGDLLKGGGPGPSGAGLPGLLLGRDYLAVLGPGPGLEGGQDGHYCAVGALAQSPAPALGSGAACCQPDSTVR